MQDRRRCVLFLNGQIQDYGFIHSLINDSDTLVAVDGGLQHCLNSGLIPHILIGDLDSITEENRDFVKKRNIEVLKFPVEKDATDFELALQLAVEQGYETVLVIAGLGGRLDQSIGNLFLLANPMLTGKDVRFVDGQDEVFLIDHQAEIDGQPGDIVSLIPLTDDVVGVITDGLRYPLNRETLKWSETRGVSNVMRSNQAHISIESGLLLCVHTRSSQRTL